MKLLDLVIFNKNTHDVIGVLSNYDVKYEIYRTNNINSLIFSETDNTNNKNLNDAIIINIKTDMLMSKLIEICQELNAYIVIGIIGDKFRIQSVNSDRKEDFHE